MADGGWLQGGYGRALQQMGEVALPVWDIWITQQQAPLASDGQVSMASRCRPQCHTLLTTAMSCVTLHGIQVS